MIFKSFLLVLLFSITVSNADFSKNLLDNIKAQPSLSTLANFMNYFPQDKLALLSNNEINITLFAPSNEAIQSVELELAKELNNAESFISYHFIRGSIPTSSLSSLNYISTGLNASGSVLKISKNGNEISLNFGIKSVIDGPAKIITADIKASNGYIHIIDKVLRIPESLTQSLTDSKKYPNFLKALTDTQVGATIDSSENVTIFVPADDAFAHYVKTGNVSSATLENQFVTGTSVSYLGYLTNGQNIKMAGGKTITVSIKSGTVYVGDAKIITPDVLLSNGVAHIVDKVYGAAQKTGDSSSLVANLMINFALTSFTIFFLINII